MVIDVEITGRAAHAGMAPEKGISAIRVASSAISANKEGWIDKETTVNVGVIEGGVGSNSVPEKTRIKAECRSLTHRKCIAQSQLIKKIFEEAAKSAGAQAQIKIKTAYEAVKIPENTEIITVAKRAIKSVGLEPRIRIITGGTDASIYNKKGMQIVVMGMAQGILPSAQSVLRVNQSIITHSHSSPGMRLQHIAGRLPMS